MKEKPAHLARIEPRYFPSFSPNKISILSHLATSVVTFATTDTKICNKCYENYRGPVYGGFLWRHK